MVRGNRSAIWVFANWGNFHWVAWHECCSREGRQARKPVAANWTDDPAPTWWLAHTLNQAIVCWTKCPCSYSKRKKQIKLIEQLKCWLWVLLFSIYKTEQQTQVNCQIMLHKPKKKNLERWYFTKQGERFRATITWRRVAKRGTNMLPVKSRFIFKVMA